tara:strand:+ start:140 stop:316 length:177 start_codon:yes stop_codon:yes gene_type:complete
VVGNLYKTLKERTCVIKLTALYCAEIEAILKKNANIINIINLENLYFNSLIELKYFPE